MPDQWGNPTLEELKERMPANRGASARWSAVANSPQAMIEMTAQRRSRAIVRADDFGDDMVDKVRRILRANPGASPEALVTAYETGEDPDSQILTEIFKIDADISAKSRADYAARGGSASANSAAGGDPVSSGGPRPLESPTATLAQNVLPYTFSAFDTFSRAFVGGLRGAAREAEEGDYGQAFLQVMSGLAPGLNMFLDATDILDPNAPSPYEQTELGQALYSGLGIENEAGESAPTQLNPLRVAGTAAEAFRDPDAQGMYKYFNEQQNSEAMQRLQRAQRRSSPKSMPGNSLRVNADGQYERTGIWTPGQFAVDVLPMDPNTTLARSVSGMVDAAVLIGVDPIGTSIGAGVKVASQARRVAKIKTAVDLQKAFDDVAESRRLTGDQKVWMQQTVDNLAKEAQISGEEALARWINYFDRAEELEELDNVVRARNEAANANAAARVGAVHDEALTAQQKIFDDAQAAKERFGPQLDEARAAAEREGLAARTVLEEGEEIGTPAAGTARAPTLAEAVEQFDPGTLQTGLRTLATEVDVPGVRVWTPRTGWRGTGTLPFDSADDFWLAIGDGEPMLFRAPQRGTGAARQADEAAPAAQAAEGMEDVLDRFAALQGSTGEMPKYVARVYDAQGNSLYMSPTDANIDVAIRSSKAKDVADASRMLPGRRAWRYTDDGEWVEETIAEVQFGQRGTKLETATLSDVAMKDFQVGPQRVGDVAKGDTVTIGKGKKNWRVTRIADDGRLWLQSEGGATKSADPATVNRVGETGAQAPPGRMVDAQEPIGLDDWNSLIAAMPKRVADRIATLGRVTQRQNRQMPTWGQVLDELAGLEKVDVLQRWVLNNGVNGITRWGRAEDVTWLPDAFGGTGRRISQTEIDTGTVKAPQAVAAATERVKQLELLLKQMDAVARQAQRNMDRINAYKGMSEKIAAQYATELAEAQARHSAVVQEMVQALREASTARVRALEEAGASDAIAAQLKDFLFTRSPNQTWDKENLDRLAFAIDPNRGALANAVMGPIDRLFGRMMAEELPEVIAQTGSKAALNRLFKGRIDEEDVLDALRNATTGDEVRDILATNLVKYQDVFARAARHTPGYVLKADSSKGLARAVSRMAQSNVWDRTRRLGEQVSQRTPWLDFTNPTQSGMDLHRWLRTGGMSTEKADKLVDAYMDAEPHTRARVVWDTIIGTIREDALRPFREAGEEPPADLIETMNKGLSTHQKRWDDAQADFVSRMRDAKWDNPDFVQTGGSDRTMSMDSLHSEGAMLDEGMALPDVKAVRSLSYRLGRFMAKHPTLLEGAEIANMVNDFWRTSLLIRPAYILRNIAEASARLFVRGSVGLFTNPLAVLSIALGEARGRLGRFLYEKAGAGRGDVLYMAGPDGDLRRVGRGELTAEDFDRRGRLLNDAMREHSETNVAGWQPQDFRAVSSATRGFAPRRIDDPSDPGYWTAHARELMRMRNDRILRALVGDYEEFPTLGRMMNEAAGSGGDVNKQIVWRKWLDTDEGRAAVKRRVESSRQGSRDRDNWADPDFWIEYLFTGNASKTRELDILTGGNQALRNYVATGTVRDEAGEVLWSDNELWNLRARGAVKRQADVSGTDPRLLNDDNALQRVAAAVKGVGARDPLRAQRFPMVELVPERGNRATRAGRAAADWWFDFAGGMERRTTWNVEWRYNYYRRSMELIEAGALSKEDALKWLDAIEDTVPQNLRAGMKRIDPTKPFASARRQMKDAPVFDEVKAKVQALPDGHEGVLVTDDVRKVAGTHASEINKEMFYNALSMNNLWQALRFAIPFGAPTVDSYKAFTKSVFDVKNVTTRHLNFERMMTTLATPDSGVINEVIAQAEPGDYDQMIENNPRLAARPFLFRTQENSALQFRMPLVGSYMGWVADKLAMGGQAPELADAEMSSYVSGLNLAFQGLRPTPREYGPEGGGSAFQEQMFQVAALLPGVGFSLQMPASAFRGAMSSTHPAATLMREWVFPFGPEDPRNAFYTMMPSWFRRAVVGGLVGDPQELRTTQNAVLNWLATRNTTGVDWASRKGQLDLEDQSFGVAKWMAFLDGVTDGIGPTGTTWQLPIIDERHGNDGATYLQYLVAEEFRQIADSAPSYDDAVLEMLDRYGPNIAMLMESKTSDLENSRILSVQAWTAFKDDKTLEQFRPVLNDLFPGDISWKAYEWDQFTGKRRSLTPAERIKQAAAQKYSWQVSVLEARAEREGWADEYFEAQKSELKESVYYNNPPMREILTETDAASRINLLREAVRHPALADVPTADMATDILNEYDYYSEVAEQETGSGLSSKAASAQREAFLLELLTITSADPNGDNLRRLFTNAVEPED